MTKALRKAFNEASRLPEPEQEAFGEWMLAKLASERKWDRAFANSRGLLAKLGREALAEHRK
ncbi:MAG: hypothetical protein ACREQI_07140 [Candidatus Binataceae bacterium]